MHKFWLVVKQEYLIRVRKKSFIVGTLSFPLIFGIIIAVTIFIIERDKNTKPLGYVDHCGILTRGLLPELEDDEEMIEMVAYPNQEIALTALEAGNIQAFQVIPENYLESHKVDLYYWEEYPDQSVLNDFNDFIRANLLPAESGEIQIRIIEGVNLTLQSADGTRKFNQESGFMTIVFPMAVAMFFVFTEMGASGYFLQAITDEKENRTMEIAITSISPLQLIGGKSMGLIAVALTQITIWLTTIVITLMLITQIFPQLQGVVLPWEILLVFIFFFIPTFALIGGMMIAIGGAVTELQEGQQISGILSLLFTFPLFLIALVLADPNSPFLIFLSFWPTTSFLMITLRWGLTIIPIWQIILSWFILVFSGALIVWIASRIFRIGMLRYGKRLSLEAVIGAVRSLDIR
jgi:ABC-2 type transport system permease protein